jgi:predicted nucleic acid-binding Zn ribbon protein
VRRERRGPRPLGSAIEAIRTQLAPRTLLADVQTVWRDAVGERVAAEAQPTSERAGVVTVSCSASVWAHELDLMSPMILERLSERLGPGRIQRLRCTAMPPNHG